MKVVRNREYFRRRGGGGHAGAQPRDEVHGLRTCRPERSPRADTEWKVQSRRGDADDRDARPHVRIEELVSDDQRIAVELLSPAGVAQHHHRRCACDVVLGAKEPAKQRTRAEHVEEVPGHARLREDQRDVAVGDRRGIRAIVREPGDVLHRARVAEYGGESLEIRREKWKFDARVVIRPEDRDAVLVAHRQLAQQHGIVDGDHRDGHPDADAEDQDCRDGERRRTTQPAKRETNVLEQPCHVRLEATRDSRTLLYTVSARAASGGFRH